MFLYEITCYDSKVKVFGKSVVSEDDTINTKLVEALMDTVDPKKITYDRVEVKASGEVTTI